MTDTDEYVMLPKKEVMRLKRLFKQRLGELVQKVHKLTNDRSVDKLFALSQVKAKQNG